MSLHLCHYYLVWCVGLGIGIVLVFCACDSHVCRDRELEC